MSSPVFPGCAVCGQLSVGEYEKSGTYLCDTHMKEWTKREKLIENLNHSLGRWAEAHGLSETEVESVVNQAFGVKPLKLVRSDDAGDDYESGYKRPFSVVPEDSLEFVRRDVTVHVRDLPIWGVEPMYHRIRAEMKGVDVGVVEASLTIDFEHCDEAEYAKLESLSNLFWTEVEVDPTKTRLYPSRRARNENK